MSGPQTPATAEDRHLVLIRGGGREETMSSCPSDEVLTLYASTPDDAVPDDADLLEGWTAERIEAHVASCTRCRSTVEVDRALRIALRDDGVAEPPGAFWDAMADDVMASLDLPVADARGADDADVIPLRRPGVADVAAPAVSRPDAGPAVEAGGSARRPLLWAVAAAVVIGLTVGAYLLGTQERGGAGEPDRALADGGSGEAPAPGESAASAAAHAAAAELGLSPAATDPVELAAADAYDLEAGLGDASASLLGQALQGSEGSEEIELSMATEDAVGALVELDDAAIERILDALESKT